jgi:hypothetical protein
MGFPDCSARDLCENEGVGSNASNTQNHNDATRGNFSRPLTHNTSLNQNQSPLTGQRNPVSGFFAFLNVLLTLRVRARQAAITLPHEDETGCPHAEREEYNRRSASGPFVVPPLGDWRCYPHNCS